MPPQGFKYLYLTPHDYTRISATNAVHCHHVEEAGESRYHTAGGPAGGGNHPGGLVS